MISSSQLFLSAVSTEFRRCREMLRADLTGPDMPWKVCEQSDFAVGGLTLLEKLDRYIRESSAVIHLVGDAMGSLAKPLEVEAYLQDHPDFLANHPVLRGEIGDCLSLSYTQWEAYMALHHDIPLYLYLPAEDFTDRQPGFVSAETDREFQEAHLRRLKSHGLDRSTFTSAERLCSMVFRSLSRMIARSDSASDRMIAKSLEGFAQFRDAGENAGGETSHKTTIPPLNVELILPSHLITGQSGRVEFHIREPGRTPLENVFVEFEVGAAKVSARRDLLARGEAIRLTSDAQLIPQEAGTTPIKLAVTCSRLSSLQEKFVWRSFANIHPRELSGKQRVGEISLPVQLSLEEEWLRARQGICGIELRPVPAAGKRFEMGSLKTERGRQVDEERHPVLFRHSWWFARHPVSQAQFLAVMERNPSRFRDQSPDFPVESVTWHEAVEFCERLTQMERADENLPLGFEYRLPTEAQWEFAARDNEAAIAVHKAAPTSSNVAAVAHPISPFPLDGNRGANHLGLCDMTGNVFQWCLDGYGAYPQRIESDPCLTGDPAARVIRGGSWNDPSNFRRSAARAKCDPETRSSRIGFRVVLARV